jgi:hypothetical protein
MTERAVARAILDRIQADPAFFFTDILGCSPWEAQVEMACAVRDHKEVAVKSCHAIGKDWIAARIALWFLVAHSPSLVITTAPTDRQCKEILWHEIEQAYARSKVKIGGKLLTQELTLNSSQKAIGFTSKFNDPDRFQGFHCPNLLVILDESSGISKETYTAVDACLTSANSRRLEIGNPTLPMSEFARSFKTSGIHRVSVAAWDTPNFKPYGITQQHIADGSWQRMITGPLPRPELITPEWVHNRYMRWGENNPLYQSRVFAEFPTSSEDTLISMSMLMRAHQLDLEPGTPDVLSVDVARSGSDYTVITHRRGGVVRRVAKYNGLDTMTTTGKIVRLYNELHPSTVVVDVIGIGSGVVDRLKELNVPCKEFNGGSEAHDSTRFVNLRTESYYELREALERGEVDLDQSDDDLTAQLADIKWSVDSRGRIKLEPKEGIKARAGASPDDADAASMCYSVGLRAEPFYFSPHVGMSPANRRPLQGNYFGTDNPRARVE